MVNGSIDSTRLADTRLLPSEYYQYFLDVAE